MAVALIVGVTLTMGEGSVVGETVEVVVVAGGRTTGVSKMVITGSIVTFAGSISSVIRVAEAL